MIRDRDALCPRMVHLIVSLLLAAAMPSCGTGVSFNDPLVPPSTASLNGPILPIQTIEPAAGPPSFSAASDPRKFCGFEYPDPGPHFVGLALSGGGARSSNL